jgi:hypothetical protein
MYVKETDEFQCLIDLIPYTLEKCVKEFYDPSYWGNKWLNEFQT